MAIEGHSCFSNNYAADVFDRRCEARDCRNRGAKNAMSSKLSWPVG